MRGSAVGRLMLNGFLALVLVFMLAPILIVVVNSFNASAYNAWPPQGLTLEWYRRVLSNPAFQRGTVNSLLVGVLSTLIVLVLGTPMAYGLARLRVRGVAVLKSLLFSPLIVPRVATGFALFILFVSVGTLTDIRPYGTAVGVIIAHCVLILPFVVAVLAASFGEIDPIVEEAARDLGATPLQAFRLTVLPQMKGALLVSAVFAFITSFDEVEATLFVVRPAVNTLPVEMYHYLEQYQDPTVAALSALLIAFSLAVVIVAPLVVSGKELLSIMSRKGR